MIETHPNRSEQTEELPEELKAELRESRTHDLESNLTKLFDDGKTRTINETLIDYWHAHKTVIKRATMTQTLATMAKNGKAVRRAGKGVYVSNKPQMPAVPALSTDEEAAEWADQEARRREEDRKYETQ